MLEKLAAAHSELQTCLQDIQGAFQILESSFRKGGKLLVCGNGGSAADSEHIVGELMKGFRLPRALPEAFRRNLIAAFPEDGNYLAGHLQGALPAISLTGPSALVSAFANDVAADMVFAQLVYGYGVQGDVLLAISTSGNSKNVIHALQVGRSLGLHTIGLTGRAGGVMKAFCEITICAPADTTDEIQEKHVIIYHTLCALLEEAFFSP